MLNMARRTWPTSSARTPVYRSAIRASRRSARTQRKRTSAEGSRVVLGTGYQASDFHHGPGSPPKSPFRDKPASPPKNRRRRLPDGLFRFPCRTTSGRLSCTTRHRRWRRIRVAVSFDGRMTPAAHIRADARPPRPDPRDRRPSDHRRRGLRHRHAPLGRAHPARTEAPGDRAASGRSRRWPSGRGKLALWSRRRNNRHATDREGSDEGSPRRS